jgi:hypothetical protein
MATLTVTSITTAGVSPAGVAAAGGGDSFPNTGGELLLITNAGGGDITLTAATSMTVEGLAVADLAVVIPAGQARALGPFPRYLYGTSVALTYSGVTSVSVKVLKFTPAAS